LDKYTERRKYERLPIELSLEISRIFKQDYIEISDIDAEINVTDISKAGIGFLSTAELPVNYYFNGKITLSEGEFFYAVIEILRKNDADEGYHYGAQFVGLAPFLAEKIDQYAKTL